MTTDDFTDNPEAAAVFEKHNTPEDEPERFDGVIYEGVYPCCDHCDIGDEACEVSNSHPWPCTEGCNDVANR